MEPAGGSRGLITAELLDLGAGSAGRPVRGSGVFVGGHGDWTGAPDGGTVRVTTLRTAEIHADGGIQKGTPDLISAECSSSPALTWIKC